MKWFAHSYIFRRCAAQFFITFAATPWLDGKHVVFGRVTLGCPAVTAVSLWPVCSSHGSEAAMEPVPDRNWQFFSARFGMDIVKELEKRGSRQGHKDILRQLQAGLCWLWCVMVCCSPSLYSCSMLFLAINQPKVSWMIRSVNAGTVPPAIIPTFVTLDK